MNEEQGIARGKSCYGTPRVGEQVIPRVFSGSLLHTFTDHCPGSLAGEKFRRQLVVMRSIYVEKKMLRVPQIRKLVKFHPTRSDRGQQRPRFVFASVD
jgi:hypothetical protein